MRAIILSLVVLAAFAAADAQDDDLLANPSFEQPNAAGDMPDGWQWGRIYGKGPLHFEWTSDARTGERAFRMTSLHATQVVYQDLAIPAGTRYTYRIHAKGSGKLRFSIQPRMGTDVVKPTVSEDWTLTDRWLDYWASGVVPEGCERVRFHILTPMTGCDVLLDDAEMTLGEPQPQVTADSPGPTGHSISITDGCRLQCVPYAGTDLAGLTDNDLFQGGLRPSIHPGRGVRFAFHFPHPATVTGIRFAQGERRPATSYLIDADTDGDGAFDTTLVRVTGVGAGGQMIRHWFEPIEAHAIRFCGLQGHDKYGRVYPTLTEFRILVQPSDAPDLPGLGPPLDVAPPLHPVSTPRALPAVTRDLSVPMADRTSRGMFVEPWMFGMGKDTPPPFEDLRSLDQFLWRLDYLGADHVWLFPRRPGTHCPCWPSEFVEGSEWDVLTPLVETLAERDIRTFVIFGRMGKPLREGASYPDWHGGLLGEVAARGAHGASLCADEYPQCGGKPDPEAYAAALKAELGLDERPPVREDTEDYRRWLVFHYGQIAASHLQAGERALAINPDFQFVSNWRVDPVALNETYGRLAYDILGRECGLHFMGTDPYYSEAGRRTYMERIIKLLAAAGRPNGSIPVLKGGSWDFAHLDRYRGILLNGSAIASVMHGASGASFYRMNYLFMNNKSHLVREAFSMIEWLDSVGLRDTRIPPTIAVLHSRASEDFYQLRQEMTIGADLKVDGIRGYVAHKIIEEFLLRNSLPFEVHYLEREDELADLGRYPVIVLPFGYCISDAAVAALDRAVKAGSKLLICERLGEADELGTLRTDPALAGWAEREGVEFVEDLVGRFTEPDFRGELLGALDGLLGEAQRISVDRDGANVEVIIREGDGHWLLACINWEPHEVVMDVRLRVPEGSYTVTQCDGYGTRPAAIAERTGDAAAEEGEFLWGALPTGGDITLREELTAEDLRLFGVHLERDQVRIYDVRRAGG